MSKATELQETVTRLEKDVEYLKANQIGVYTKLDSAITGIQEFNSNLSRVIALLDQRLAHHEEDDKEFHAMVIKDHELLADKLEKTAERLSEIVGALNANNKSDTPTGMNAFVQKWKYIGLGALMVIGILVSAAGSITQLIK